MDEIIITKKDNYLLICFPYMINAHQVKKFIFTNLELLMNNNLLWDMRRFGMISLDSNFVSSIIHIIKLFQNHSDLKRNAFVATEGEQLNSLMGIIQILKNRGLISNIKCFSYIESSITWIHEK